MPGLVQQVDVDPVVDAQGEPAGEHLPAHDALLAIPAEIKRVKRFHPFGFPIDFHQCFAFLIIPLILRF